jgi:hypothetical protein
MSEEHIRSVAELLADRELIDAALSRAARDAILEHARAGHPVATWKDGQVVWLSPEEVLARHNPNGAPVSDHGRPTENDAERTYEPERGGG